ncbi:MAG: hemerythrin domain-containing protein [Thermoplasmata archaeon]
MTEPSAGLASALQEDHDRLDLLLDAFRSARTAPAEERERRFGPFAAGLRAHLRFEEEVAFPQYGPGDPALDPTRQLLLDEHRRIREALDRIEGRLAAGGDTADLEEELLNVLWAHDAREEGQVYPWLDEHLSPAAIAGLLATFRRSVPQG